MNEADLQCSFAARETIQAYPVTRPIIIWILGKCH